MTLRLDPHPSGIILNVKVVPNSSRDQLAGLLGDALKIKVAKPPEDGAANRAVEQLLASVLHIPAKRVSVIAGHTQPRKRILIEGLSAATVEGTLLPPAPNRTT